MHFPSSRERDFSPHKLLIFYKAFFTPHGLFGFAHPKPNSDDFRQVNLPNFCKAQHDLHNIRRVFARQITTKNSDQLLHDSLGKVCPAAFWGHMRRLRIPSNGFYINPIWIGLFANLKRLLLTWLF